VLARVGGPPIRLVPDKTFTVGRSPERDLTVPSQRVSRMHAEITWRNGKPVLRDLGSQNGTLVNGRRVAEHPLRNGDEIEFGPFLCTFNASPGAEAEDDIDPNLLTKPMVADAMAGRLDQIELGELLSTLEFNAKTGTLQVFGPGGDGQIVFRQGKPVFAKTADQEGEEAIYHLLGYKRGQFSFSGTIDEEGANVDKSMGSLLMEAARRVDEGGAEGGDDLGDTVSEDDVDGFETQDG
jgi:hypothetical protein